MGESCLRKGKEEEGRREREREGRGGKEGGLEYTVKKVPTVCTVNSVMYMVHTYMLYCVWQLDVSDSLVIQMEWSKLLTVMAAYRLPRTAVAPHTGT